MSKSGSKALSKSVDSVVKSVESVVSSVLPKNMNMKHVLLAILVGLLLCMLMGNTVEGFNMYTIDSTGVSPAVDAGPATGFCRTGSSAIMQRSCVPSDASIVGAGTDADGVAKQTSMNNVCSSPEVSSVGRCLGKSDAPGERSGPFIVQKMTDEDLNPATDNLECTFGDEVDQCATAAFNNSQTCTSSAGKDQGCVWEGCEFTGNNTVMMGADNSNPDAASIVLDLKDPFLPEYDRWRKCLFGNKNSLLEGADAAVTVPVDLNVGEFPNNSGAGSTSGWPAPGASGGSGVPNLDGWVTGKHGYGRTEPTMTSVTLTAAELVDMNAIPMTADGKVTPTLATHLPPAWKTGFENMYEYCKSGNPNEYAAIGWSPDFRSLQCLNWNPTHKKINITTQKTRHPCGPCLGECLTGKDYSYDKPNKAESVVNCNKSLTDRATAMAKIATSGNLATVKEGGTEIATNLLKFIVS
jgi:hypothetical protein